MLHAIGFPDDQMPQLLVHGWWNIGGAKMSKSVGNIVDPFVLAEKYGSEALRYYLMSDIATGQDADFSEERLVSNYNDKLANSLGNLLSRILNMLHRYCSAKVIKRYKQSDVIELTFCPEFAWPNSISEYENRMGDNQIGLGLKEVGSMATFCDMFIQARQPWVMAKNPDNANLLAAILYQLAESLRIIAILISPVMPRAAHGIFDQLNWKMELSGKEERFSLADAEWGKLPDGHVVGKPTPLFPRIEILENV
jgi:methionyl-tRNA synthetase